MRSFINFLFSGVLIATALFIYSCSKESNINTTINGNHLTENRSIACPTPNLSLVTIWGSPCASLKFVYNGTDDPNSTCKLLKFDIKTFKVWGPNQIKDFNSPLINTSGTYPINSNWVSTLSGGLINLAAGPTLGVFNIPTPITRVNDTFEYFIQSTPQLGDKTWVCVEIVMDCNGEECKTTKCFDAFTPCI